MSKTGDMRLPLPRNRLVALTLLGALVSAGAAISLATPQLLTGTGTEPQAGSEVMLGPPAPEAWPTPPLLPAGGTDAVSDAATVSLPPPELPASFAPATERDYEAMKKQMEWERELQKQQWEEAREG